MIRAGKQWAADVFAALIMLRCEPRAIGNNPPRIRSATATLLRDAGLVVFKRGDVSRASTFADVLVILSPAGRELLVELEANPPHDSRELVKRLAIATTPKGKN